MLPAYYPNQQIVLQKTFTGGIDTVVEVAQWISKLQPFPEVILLEGEIGAGKTTLMSMLLQQLGNYDKVTSPTFTLVNEYQTPAGVIYHMDWYRINDLEELLEIGAPEYFYDRQGTVIVEWPEIGSAIIPKENLLLIEIEHLKNQRTYKLTYTGSN